MREIAQEMVDCIDTLQLESKATPEDIVIHIVHLDYGMGVRHFEQEACLIRELSLGSRPNPVCSLLDKAESQ